MKTFCDFISSSPKRIIEDYENSERDRDFKKIYMRKIRSLISAYFRKGYTNNSIKVMLAVIRSFFKYNDLPIGYIPTPKSRTVYHNRDITSDEIREILKVSKPRERAFYVMMAQTGLRPDTLCNLKIKHIEPDFSKEVIPCKVMVPEELTKGEFGSYFTFMGEEATKYLHNYLLTRRTLNPESYIFSSYGKEKPFHPKSVSSIFARTLETLKEKGALNFQQKEEGKPRNVRLYNLRKFFRKNAGQAGIEYVNFWMGHKTNYKAPYIPASDVHYFSRDDVEFQRKIYKEKASPFLRLEVATPTETDKILSKQQKEIDKLKEENEELRITIEQLKEVDDNMKDFLTEVRLNFDKKLERLEELERKLVNRGSDEEST